MHWIERRVALPLRSADAYPLAVEPGTIHRWFVQVREVRPRGFLHLRPRLRHGAVSLDVDAHVVRAVVPSLAEVEFAWRNVRGRLVLELEDADEGCEATLRIGLDLPPALRLARHGIALELSRMMLFDLRRLRRLARAEAAGATVPDDLAAEDGEGDEGPADDEDPAREWDDAGDRS
ncbi:MAG: hypothetical protein M0P31_08005 [Solirubrobacteraceae bacterium]|nr:hypothetical protein [Solirubrobacteraceae bacterium]